MGDRTVIFHIDVNSAFLSWEACYRIHHLGGTLDLREQVAAVGGDVTMRHGIILAKSIPSKQYGIQTVIENYSQPISTCATIADIDFYLSQIPQLGYALDTGNYWFNDLDSLDACKLFLPRIAHVHLKDIQPMTTDAARTLLGKRFDCVSPGSGVIHIAEILDVLTSFGYDGVFSLEVNTKNDLQKKLMQILLLLAKEN